MNKVFTLNNKDGMPLVRDTIIACLSRCNAFTYLYEIIYTYYSLGNSKHFTVKKIIVVTLQRVVQI